MIVSPEQFEFDRDKARNLREHVDDPALSADTRDLIRQAGEVQPSFTEVSSHCFYCGEKLTIPAIMWNGQSGDGKEATAVWLHPKCAEAFCAGISRDVDELNVGKEKADAKLSAWKHTKKS